MCIQAPSQEPPSPSSPERTNSEPQPQPINSEPQPPPEPASESRKRAMPEPYTPEPNPKPHHEPKRHGVSSGSTPLPPPPPLIPVEFTDAFVKDLFKYLPMPLEELNRLSPSSRSTLPPPSPSTAFGEDLFKFLPSTLYDEEPLPLNTIFPLTDAPDLGTIEKDWTPPVPINIDERIFSLADPIDLDEVVDAPHHNRWEYEANLRRRKLSDATSPSMSYVPVDHAGNTDLPVPTPLSRSVGAGIENLGNTCFMAAILQCLTHTGQLLFGLRQGNHETPCRVRGFCVICAFREHFDRAVHPSRNTIRPTRFLLNVNHFSDNFVAHSQEDAHEFMICALNKLKSAIPEQGPNNLIEQIFGGKTVSQLRCRSCGFSSDTIEPILDLGLAVDNESTVQRALDSYIMVENMDGMFKCSSCDQEVYMEKQLLIDKAPEIAVLHLKRFKKDRSTYEKIENHVYFTLKLDLEPYTSAKGRENPILMYDLYAVVVHSGSTANSGHYFSYVRSDEDTWHLMDDAQVFSVSEEHVLAQQAYMLFYAKQGTAWFSSIVEIVERDVRSVSTDNTQGFGSGENDFFDYPEATDNDSPHANDDDSMRANDDDSMRANDSDSTYGIDTDSPDGKEKTASDMEEEEECDSAGVNDKDSKDADDNDSKVTDDNDSKVTYEKSGSGVDGVECDLADANDDKDSKDADDNDSKVTNEKSWSHMDVEECDLAEANDKDSKDANDNHLKNANVKSVTGMDGADGNDSKDANDNDSKVTNEKSVSPMDVEECDLADANDKDSKDANDKDSKDANVKSVSGMDVEECDLADANDKDSRDANDNDLKDANEKSVTGMDGADGNDSNDANGKDSKDANEKSVSRMDVEECDLAEANDKDSKDANDNDLKDANEKSVTGMDGADGNDSKDANDNDSKVTNEKSVSPMDVEECDLADANDKDSKDANDKDSKDANVKSVSGKDVEECDLADVNDKDSKDANDNDLKDANEKSVTGMDGGDGNDSKDANDYDSKVTNEKSVSPMDVEECDLADANDKDSKDANDSDLKDANEKSVTGMDGADGNDSKDANDNDSKVTNEKSVSGMDGEECDLADANDKDSKDANDDNDSKVANERLGSDMDEDDVIPQCKCECVMLNRISCNEIRD